VDLRASVETVLGRRKAPDVKGQPKPAAENKSGAGTVVKPNSAAAAKLGLKPVSGQALPTSQPGKPAPNPAASKSPTAPGAASVSRRPDAKPSAAAPSASKSKAAHAAAPEFEVSAVPGWEEDPEPSDNS
jgi:hypothetical protein